jgi:hypothetical protein
LHRYISEAIHKLYRPVSGEYDDYITKKKKSGYQSLHTAVVGPDGALLEFQVRTRAMHDAAEFGNAAHWLYKDLTKPVVGPGGDANASESASPATATASSATAASASTASADEAAAEVGQPVHIVLDRESGGGFSAGVVCWSGRSRVHVVEPIRGDTYAPGLASTGVVDNAEWVAMGLHTALLDRAVRAGRVAPGQSGRGYWVLEFALCSDGRWHKVDSYGRKLGITAELLDEELLKAELLEALETAAEEEAAEEEAVEEATEAVPAVTAAEADEVVAAFEARLTAAAASEDPAGGDERVERGSFFDTTPTTTVGADGGASGGADVEVGGVVGMASPDDEMVDSRVRAMQSSLQAYLDPASVPDEEFAFDPENSTDGQGYDDEDDDDAGIEKVKEEAEATAAAAAASGVAGGFPPATPQAGSENGATAEGGEEQKQAKTKAKGLWRFGPFGGRAKKTKRAPVELLTVEQAVSQAREELRLSSARAAEEAAAERRRARRAKQEVAWRSGETDSPLFSIVQAGVAPGLDDAKPLGILNADEAAQLEAVIGLKLTKMAQASSTKAPTAGGGGD